MKRLLLFCLIMISLKSNACKCPKMDLIESFKYSEFVIIGKVTNIIQIPNSNHSSNNILNILDVKNIYKSYYADDFKSKKATLFSTSVNCLDYKYLKDEEYIIFGYTEPDTGLIYSDNCTYTRKVSELSKVEIEKLELLKIEYWKNNIGLKSIDKLDDLYINNPNVPIKKLRRESELINERYNKTKKEIKIQQTITYILVGVIVVLILLFILKRLKK